MKNLLGEEVQPRKLTFERKAEHIWIRSGLIVVGLISKNGWTGKSICIDYPKGEMVLSNIHGDFSLSELKQIIHEVEKHDEQRCQ